MTGACVSVAVLLAACGSSDGAPAATADAEAAALADAGTVVDAEEAAARRRSTRSGTSSSGTSSTQSSGSSTSGTPSSSGGSGSSGTVEAAAVSATAPGVNDPRRAYWLDPRLPFAQSASSAMSQVAAQPNLVYQTLPDTGLLGANGEHTFQRVVDPLNSGKRAFLHRIKPEYPSWGGGGTWRSEVSSPGQNDGTNVVRGQEYWMAYAFKPESDVANGSASVSILDVHAADGSSNGGPSPISVIAGKGGLSIIRSWNPVFYGTTPQREYYSVPFDTTQWNYLIFNFRFHYDSSQAPFLKIWQVSGDGALTQRVNVQGPVGYNETPVQQAVKFGLYRWDAWGGDPVQSRTSYTKGLYLFKAGSGSPALDQNAMLALLKSI